jgi:aspartyl protease family protein
LITLWNEVRQNQPAGIGKGTIIALILALAVFANVVLAQQATIRVVALFENKAMLSVDGSNIILAEGDTSDHGITLVEADQFHAVIDYMGRKEELTLSSGNVLLSPGSQTGDNSSREKSLVLYADSNGMFHTSGRINGVSVRFVVDTGATAVALSSAMASRIGVDYRNGQAGFAQTASGIARTYLVTLDRVQVGAITLRYVEAAIVEGNFPAMPLLGMSFLGNLEMQQSGNRMELISR